MARIQVDGKELIRLQVQGKARTLVMLRGPATTKLFEAHPLVEKINGMLGTGLKVISPKLAAAALAAWAGLVDVAGLPSSCGVPLDAAIAYEAPGTRLGTQIVFSALGRSDDPTVVLPTGRYKGGKNAALVAFGLSGKDFVKDGRSIILDIPDGRLTLVRGFPARNGWHMLNEAGVPCGRTVMASPRAVYLRRSENASYAGLLVRGDYLYDDPRSFVSAHSWMSSRWAVVAEVPEADVPKIEGIIRTRAK